MFVFVVVGVLFRFSAKRPAVVPLFQLPPANAPRAGDDRSCHPFHGALKWQIPYFKMNYFMNTLPPKAILRNSAMSF